MKVSDHLPTPLTANNDVSDRGHYMYLICKSHDRQSRVSLMSSKLQGYWPGMPCRQMTTD